MLNAVLVIDDSEDDRYLVRRAMKKAKVAQRVLEFPDAASALELVSDREEFERQCGPWPPRAVALVDINMPRMNGFEFIEALDRRIQEGVIPMEVIAVAMYSTSNRESDLNRALNSRIVMDYIVKPITVEMAERIAKSIELLDRNERPSGPAT